MNVGNGTHWRMPDRSIRLVEEGDTIDSFRGRERRVKKRDRKGHVTFEDGMSINVTDFQWDDVNVTIIRPRAKVRDGWNPDPEAHYEPPIEESKPKAKAKRSPRKPGPVTVRKVATS